MITGRLNRGTIFLLPLLLLLAGCDLYSGLVLYPPVQEGLVSLEGGAHTYKLSLPEGFGEDGNFMNLYPLVISLHGSTSLTDHYYVVSEVRDAYPCVYFAPNNTNLGFGGDLGGADNSAWIRAVIRGIIENRNYKIDRNRIYIIGFSMGAMGTTYMAQDLYTEYGYLTAAIVPAEGGWFGYMKSKEVLDHVCCWFHLGSASPYYDGEADYKEARKYYPGTLEIAAQGRLSYSNSWDPSTVYSYDTATYTLRQAKRDIFKSTTYAGLGHSAGPVFKDPEVIGWLFDQNLANRDLY